MIEKKRELLRDDLNGKIAGVCAGIADYFGWELWLVRVVTLASVLLGFGTFIPVLYLVGWIVLRKKSQTLGSVPAQQPVDAVFKPVEVKTRIWQRGESARQASLHIRRQFDEIEHRVRNIESYVTSNRYQLDREFRKL
jgi:phage shock protein C